MATILLLAVLFGSVVAIILMVYLIDRVKRLESLSIQANNNRAPFTGAVADNGFLGLSGNVLWDAMSGTLPEGFKEGDVMALKSRFEFILQNHIESLFKLGKKDGTAGKSVDLPGNPLEISTLRGSVASWIPPQYVTAIYTAGHESVGADDLANTRLHVTLDEAASSLFSRAGLTIKQAFSERLLPALPAAAMPSADTLLEETLPEQNEDPAEPI
tara:strand:- start:268 stop:912 length:645 start_codon:yes stop_codon:yes gene_type:complete